MKKPFEWLPEEKQLLTKNLEPLNKLQQFQAVKGAEIYFDCDGVGYFELNHITYICPCDNDPNYYSVGMVGNVGWHETDIETGENVFVEEKDREFEVSLWIQANGDAYVFSVDAT